MFVSVLPYDDNRKEEPRLTREPEYGAAIYHPSLLRLATQLGDELPDICPTNIHAGITTNSEIPPPKSIHMEQS